MGIVREVELINFGKIGIKTNGLIAIMFGSDLGSFL